MSLFLDLNILGPATMCKIRNVEMILRVADAIEIIQVVE